MREQPPSQCVPCLFGALPRMSLALPVQPAHELDARPAAPRWLIEGLWADEAVGIVGGEPKSFKSFLVLDMAVAVASGSPCLRHFPVAHTGRVLLYAAEDALQVVRRRLEGICHLTHLNLAQLDIQVITAPSLRLDTLEDQKRLRFTIEQLRPRLLLLDPFVRLHRIDENASYLFTADAGVGAGQKRPPRLSYSACSGPGGSRFANWANGLNGLRASWVD